MAMLLLLGIGAMTTVGASEKDAPPKDSTWNVLDFGALADGQSDATAAFQKALDAAGQANGGIVLAPTGRYSFAGSLRVPKAVTLRGVFGAVPSHAGIRDKTDEKPVYGTVLMPRGGAGSEEGAAFISLNSNAVLQGVCIYYPDQNPDGPVPTPYPYAVAMRGNNPAVIDVELLNPYNGIDAMQANRHLIRNVHGQPLHIGIYVDQIYDIGRIENVHWNPWWSMQKDLFQWQMDHGIGFIFGRTDWQYVLNTFCFGYHIGYEFIQTKDGVTNGNFLGIGADDCQTALVVEQSAPFGILITNGEFVSFHGPDPTMVRVEDTNTGTVRFVNSSFWGPCNQIAVIHGTGTIGFSDCTFQQWAAQEDKDRYAIQANGGSLLIRGCDFQQDRPHILLSKGLKRAIVTDNLFRGKPRIKNEVKGHSVVKNNLGEKPENR